MTRLLKRLRRRGRRAHTWRIVLSDGLGGGEVVEVVRRYRPTRKARALLSQGLRVLRSCTWLNSLAVMEGGREIKEVE